MSIRLLLLLLIQFCSSLVRTQNGGPDFLEHLYSLKPKTSNRIQQEHVIGLAQRLMPEHYHYFDLIVDDQQQPSTIINNATGGLENSDHFRIENVGQGRFSGDGKIIRIIGNTGVAVANGLHYYLKYVGNCSVSWSGDQLTSLPKNGLPLMPRPLEMIIPEKFRYYQNTCTASYSNVWWQWPRWEREIDWMALHGINLPLAFNGQELVYRNTFLRFNLTKTDIDDYFTGPAFLAWNRMGNIQTWSGPLTEHWHQHQYELQLRILERMRNLGMQPVVPGFAGHVPRKLKEMMPDTRINRLTDWNNFGQNFSYTFFLEPEDPKFILIGQTFIQEYMKLYGTDHFYNIDLFNEETPSSNDPGYLRKCGQNVFESITAADPKAIWVMQGWLFVYESSFWKPEQVKSMVTSVPLGRMLVLDLFSDVHPVYNRFEGYYGQAFVWCMLHNFGGTHGLYGAFNRINQEFFPTRQNYSNMLGIGLTMEGIEQNPVIYDYMTEVTWYQHPPDMMQWIQRYAQRRYGFNDNDGVQDLPLLNEAWQLLRLSVYKDLIGVSNHGRYIITMQPRPDLHSQLSYDPKFVFNAFGLFARFLNENKPKVQLRMLRSETFVYDLVDLARQTLQLLFDQYYAILDYALIQKNMEIIRETTWKLSYLLELMEETLQSSQPWLLYNWIRDARALGNDTQEKDYNEWQARNQITIWGPRDNIVDYAAKQWSGMFRYYYAPRWQLYFNYLREILAKNETFNLKKFNRKLFRFVELPFTKAIGQPLVEKADTINLLSNVNQIVKELEQTLDGGYGQDGTMIPFEYYHQTSTSSSTKRNFVKYYQKNAIDLDDINDDDDDDGDGDYHPH